MGHVITAPEQKNVVGPLVFLAGPTWARVPWQDCAVEMLGSLDGRIHVANPRRPVDVNRDFDEAQYNQQVDWETQHVRRAAAHGVVMFWLAAEDVHRCDRPHAQTTRMELGEWMERARRGEAELVVGLHQGFTGARYIRRRLGQECPRVRICTSLEETCAEAAARCVGQCGPQRIVA